MIPLCSLRRPAGLLALLAGPWLLAASARAAQDKPAPGQRTTTVVAGPHYKAGPLHRLFFGPTYRKTWTTPIPVNVLDLGSFAGGLTPKKKGGGKQTKSLSFQGADGREYRFRSVDKDPTPTLPEDLQDTVADWIVQDQISASHPAGVLVVDALSEAAGIWHAARRLFVMPDDRRLGEFRQEFAGMLGLLEEEPAPGSPGFENAVKIVESEDLIKLLDAGPGDRVDTRALLKARLFDVFLGDWDRHWDQWDWARIPDSALWQPIPKDRDQAFAKFDGLVLAAARPSQPRFVDFEDEYPSMVGLNWNAQHIDRRLLTDLERPAWGEVARQLQSRLTDAAIDEAVRRLPEPYYRVAGPKMATKLKRRRDLLPEAAQDFYRLLADEVAIHATDRAERAEITRGGEGAVEVRLSLAGPEREPYYRRRFVPEETDEVRVHLAGGDDVSVTRGQGPDRIKVRVVGGDGDDVLDDSAGGNTEFFDASGDNRILHGNGTSDSDKPYVHPRDRVDNPLRDWGKSVIPLPVLAGGGDLGVLVGVRLQLTDYGFRKHPQASRQTLGAAYSTAVKGFRLDYEAEFQRTNSRKRVNLFALASDVEVVRFHGLGNERAAPEPGDFYKSEQRQFQFVPSLTLPLAALRFTFGPAVKYATTRPEPGRFLDLTRPYGVEDFGQVGARARLVLDRRNHPLAPHRGLLMWAEGNYYPEAWSVRTAFGEVHGETATYLRAPLPLKPTLALRAGGRRVWGDEIPFHEAAFIGGPDTVRGLRRQRYAGEAAAYGNAELRLTLARPKILVPTDIGVFGLGDAGRVWVDGENSDLWHHGVGGGLWLSFYRPENTISIAAARSEGRLRVYFRGGLTF